MLAIVPHWRRASPRTTAGVALNTAYVCPYTAHYGGNDPPIAISAAACSANRPFVSSSESLRSLTGIGK